MLISHLAVVLRICIMLYYTPWAPVPRVLQRWLSQPRQRTRCRWYLVREGVASVGNVSPFHLYTSTPLDSASLALALVTVLAIPSQVELHA